MIKPCFSCITFLLFLGAVLLSSPQTDESDFIWLLLSDLFPLHNVMMEAQSIIPLDGKAWAMDEVPQPRRLMKLYMDSFGSQNPPVAVIQHAQTARKFVVISAQGTHIILKLRPVDHLCKLLIDNGGPDNDVIKAFFHLHTEVQAIAICLILACSQTVESKINVQVNISYVLKPAHFCFFSGYPSARLGHKSLLFVRRRA